LGRSAGDHFHYDKVSKDNDGSDHEHHHHSHRHVRIDDVVSLSNPLDNEKILKAFEAEGPEEGLRKAARSELIVEMRPLAREGRQRSLLETLENRYVFPLPRVMIQSEKETIINEYEEGSFDSQEDAEDLEKMANRRVSLAFLFLKYASVHNIQVTNEDMTRFLLEQVEGDRQRFAKTIEALKKNQQQLVALRNAVLETKVVADLLNKISGTKRYALFSDFLLEKQSSFIQKMKNSAE
jgi:trigger factor